MRKVIPLIEAKDQNIPFTSHKTNYSCLVTTSWDDVTSVDLKLCDLLESYEIKGSFYVVNNWINRKVSVDDLRHISEKHEIGAHTLSHPKLTCIMQEEARKEISDSKRLLENIINKPVTSFAYPYGCYLPEHIRIVREAGFLCARTTLPFYTTISDPFETNVTLWAAPHRIRDVGQLFFTGLLRKTSVRVLNPIVLKKWDKLGELIFDSILKKGGIFHLFGHAWQLGSSRSWSSLERLLSHIAYRRNVIYASLSDCVKAYMNLDPDKCVY